MLSCNKCGAEAGVDASFCAKCGQEIGLYKLSDLESIGFKAEKNKKLESHFEAGMTQSLVGIPGIGKSIKGGEGLLERWEGRFPLKGKLEKVDVHIYEKNVEDSFGTYKTIESILGVQHSCFKNVIVESSKKDVCDNFIDRLKSAGNSAENQG